MLRSCMISFEKIRKRAAKRKGGEKVLQTLLPKVTPKNKLSSIPDDRILSEMTKRVFSAGFVWKVVENKWPGFEEAFLRFDPAKLLEQSNRFWDDLSSDERIIRNAQKISSVRKNAQFVVDVAIEHGSFGKFLANWPIQDQIGLLDFLSKRGARLGGNTGQYFLRFIGRDSFILSSDVILCFRDAGLPISASGKSKKDLILIQDQFNVWAKETGLPYTHLSRICAFSIGENNSIEEE
ncbi:DNA-3-methyladenine glycosylase I [Leptospira licerasiae]|uniref:Methyladenine glycosylase domain protein n=1 Tax=Leptospira licerasiae str. MMD4847 TaxID=1049971 RepID=A0ABP2RAS1_9LEPT|nr:DNA-3-methyladenine glycosylase I [Leptospira licerasiae]EID99668.1 methyladenine glycosylase domain protein [Leptospira licerasiae serovar Varillal str. VAR 010]EJZ41599.1 methyladenine glycosylase domain protein [Leptospira licerasiae str. MMD4847]